MLLLKYNVISCSEFMSWHLIITVLICSNIIVEFIEISTRKYLVIYLLVVMNLLPYLGHVSK